MKAVAVFPGTPGSIHLADLPKPSIDDIPDERGVLVEVLRVGVDGTDKRSTTPSTRGPGGSGDLHALRSLGPGRSGYSRRLFSGCGGWR
jgi:hypothetical protein